MRLSTKEMLGNYSLLSMVNLTKLEKRMATRGHYKDSGESHRRKEDVKENDIKRKFSNEKFDRKLAEIKIKLHVLMECLQKHEEDQKCR